MRGQRLTRRFATAGPERRRALSAMSTIPQNVPAPAHVDAAETVAPAAGGRWRPRRSTAGWARLISPVVVLIIWQLTHVFSLIGAAKLPPPTQVVAEAWTLISTNSPAYGTLQGAMLVSLERFAIGFTIGGAVAMVLAVIAGLTRTGDAAIDPLVQMLRTLPLFGLVPVFIVWFGIGELPKITLVALAAAVPLYLNAYAGIRSVDGRLHELAFTLKLSRRELLMHVVLPGALPNILVGLRQSLGVAWLSLVVAEQINASSGLGFMINQGQQFLQNDVIFVCLLVYTILGLATDGIVRGLERRALAWQPEPAR